MTITVFYAWFILHEHFCMVYIASTGLYGLDLNRQFT